MIKDRFEHLAGVIHDRRSIGATKMNGLQIDKDTVERLLDVATWAPTHGRTEPWQFYVYTGDALKKFGKAHADLHLQNTPEEKRNPATYEKLLHNGDKASHLVIAVMKRGDNEKIPQLEEIAATAAAIQNLLLGATAFGIASHWTSGGLTHSALLREYLGISDNDVVMGLIYLGYTDESPKAVTRSPISEKVKWMD